MLDFFLSSQRGQTEMVWPEEEQSICWSKDAEDGSAGRRSRAGVSRPSPHRLQFGRVCPQGREPVHQRKWEFRRKYSLPRRTEILSGSQLWGWVLDTSDLEDDQ